MKVEPLAEGLFTIVPGGSGWEISHDPHHVRGQMQQLQQGSEFMRHAQELWSAWRAPWRARGESDMIEVLIPRLVRRETRKRALVAAEPASLPGEREASLRLQRAQSKVHNVAQRAAKLYAAAGEDFAPPEGLSPEITAGLHYQKADAAAIEAAAAEVVAAQAARAAAEREAAAEATIVQRPTAVPAAAPPPVTVAAPAGADVSLFPPGYVFRGPVAAAPPMTRCLKRRDINTQLRGQTVQLHWPDDGLWYPAVVLAVNPSSGTAELYYETGDRESLDVAKLVDAGEIAWLAMPGHHHAASKPNQHQQTVDGKPVITAHVGPHSPHSQPMSPFAYF